MNNKIYKVVGNDTLESIAEETGYSVEEIKQWHNSHSYSRIGKMFDTWQLPLEIILPDYPPKPKPVPTPEEREKKLLEDLVLNKDIRYRCEQMNISKVNGNLITLHSEIRNQYLCSFSKDLKSIKVILEDYNFSVEPNYLSEGFEFSRQIETIKNIVVITQNKKGEVEEVLNHKELLNKWIKFRDKELPNNSLYKALRNKIPNQAQDIIDTGNKEFLNMENISKTLGKNLFFHILLRANVGNELEDYTIQQYSQLFPNLELIVNVTKAKIKEDNDTTTYKLTGVLNKDLISENEIKNKYDELYKPMIKYSFTSFDYIFDITYSIINKNNTLVNANALLCEKVKNNFEVITEFTIKQVEL